MHASIDVVKWNCTELASEFYLCPVLSGISTNLRNIFRTYAKSV